MLRDVKRARRPATRSTAVQTGLALLLAACSDGSSPVAPTQTGAAGNLITITSAGASPSAIQIRLGERVVFVNNDTVSHEMSSDLHPTHDECPQINQAGFLQPGQTRETGNFTVVEVCTFHDHLDSTNASLNGTITAVE